MFKVQTHQSLARIVLVWFALFIGVAVASPIFNPTETQMVCSSSGGMKMVSSSQEDGDSPVATNMDCPLCSPVAPVLPACSAPLENLSPLAHALHPVAAALIVSLTAPPLPSRGPPAV